MLLLKQLINKVIEFHAILLIFKTVLHIVLLGKKISRILKAKTYYCNLPHNFGINARKRLSKKRIFNQKAAKQLQHNNLLPLNHNQCNNQYLILRPMHLENRQILTAL